jgi:hypothetical protein
MKVKNVNKIYKKNLENKVLILKKEIAIKLLIFFLKIINQIWFLKEEFKRQKKQDTKKKYFN